MGKGELTILEKRLFWIGILLGSAATSLIIWLGTVLILKANL